MFDKILVANRGEIALSIIRVCREMNIPTVAVYSTADKDSLHVRFADEAVCIGPPSSHLSYLSIPSIISAAELTNATAIHPGYGFLSENAKFAKVCEGYGIKFIGPSWKMIGKMGDKASAKAAMQEVGIPTIPGSNGVIPSLDEALVLAKKIGFPVLLKATAGGGGKGIKRVDRSEVFEQKWKEAEQEALISFGNGGLYVEKCIEQPRHIEIQIIADQYGKVIHLSERDCSIQRRNQKLVEEAPSPYLDKALREKMGHVAEKGIAAIGYEGVGTIEFLVDQKGDFYFMEMNTRIQVEYAVTEVVTGFNLIKNQIEVASGMPLQGSNAFPRQHAIEVRINAENPCQDFRPSPGKITQLHFPGGRGIILSSHIYAGYLVPPYYDSMIAKLIVYSSTREKAVAKLKRALEEFVIEGIHTTIPFYCMLVDDPAFIAGNFTTAFLDAFDFSALRQSEDEGV